MITAQTVVVNQTAPDMTLDQFASVLTGKSPLTPDDILKSYQAVVAQKVSPAFLLGVFWVESKFGRLGICRDYNTKSPGNTRTSVRYTAPQIQVVSTPQGNYVRYSSWDKGFTDLAARLIEPDYVYARRGLVTVEQILPVFAPPTDNNDPASYVQSVVNMMNQWIGEGSSNAMQDPTNKIDIVHPNKGRNGGTPQIIVLHVQEGLNYLPDFFRSSGDDSTIWCKQDGTLVRMEQDTDSAWTNGYITEPIDHTNPIIQQLYNQGVRNSNDYSLTIEHQGYAAGAFTDAAIESTARMCAYWMLKYGWNDVNTRIVGHYQIGEHKNCPGPNFPWAKLRARVQDLIGVSKVEISQSPKLPAVFDPNPQKFDIGPGVLEVLNNEKMIGITNEQFFNPGSTTLGQRSFTYAQDAQGVTYQIEAIQEVDGNGTPTGPWTRQIYRFIREYK